MMRTADFLFAACLAASTVLSCGKFEPEEVEFVKLGAVTKTVVVPADTGSCSFVVVSNVEYTREIVSGGSWLSFSDAGEEGKVKLEFRANTGIKRVAKVVLGHGTRSDTVQIRQAAMEGMDEYVRLSKSSVKLAEGGDTAYVAVTTNVPRSMLKVSTYVDAIKGAKIKNDILTFHVGANNTTNPVSTVVSVSFVNGWGEEETAKVSVYQNFIYPVKHLTARIATYNLWSDSARKSKIEGYGVAPIHYWKYSKYAVAGAILDCDADIMAFQEFGDTLRAELGSLISAGDYTVYATEAEPGVYTGLGYAWKSSKFTVSDRRTAWLSPTPFEKSKGWSRDGHYRYCSTAVFTDRESARSFFLIVTHGPLRTDEYDETVGKACADAMITIAETLNTGKLPEIILGDFNAYSDDPMTAQIRTRWTDTRLYLDEGSLLGAPEKLYPATFVGSGSSPESNLTKEDHRIDYIYFRNSPKYEWSPSSYSVHRDKHLAEGTSIFPSDHLPVYSDFIL